MVSFARIKYQFATHQSGLKTLFLRISDFKSASSFLLRD